MFILSKPETGLDRGSAKLIDAGDDYEKHAIQNLRLLGCKKEVDADMKVEKVCGPTRYQQRNLLSLEYFSCN